VLGSTSKTSATSSADQPVASNTTALMRSASRLSRVRRCPTEDKAAWHSGDLSADTLRDFAKALSWRWEMNQGKAPTHYTRAALCVCCGPIWHWIEGTFLSCPWCQNRESGDPIPRPPVACRECRHWSPDKINPPGGLGSCVVRTPADWPEGAWWPRGDNHLCGLATAVGFGCHHRSGRTRLAEGVGFMKCIVVMLL